MKNLKENKVVNPDGGVEVAAFIEGGISKDRLYFHHKLDTPTIKRSTLFNTFEYLGGTWTDDHDASVNYHCMEIVSGKLSLDSMKKAFEEITGVECSIFHASTDIIDVFVSGGCVQEVFTTNQSIQVNIWDTDNDVYAYEKMKNQNHFRDKASFKVIS